MTTERQRLTDRRDLVQRDIAELMEQIADGEVDEATGRELLEGYERELAEVTAALADLPEDEAAPVAAPVKVDEATGTRSVRRVVVGSVVVIAALSVAIFLAARDATPDDPGPSGAAGPGDLSVDPAEVSNEQLEAVVAANPDIPAMRLALADRYFRSEQFSAALDHYLYVAGNNPDPADEAFALARIGWIAHATDLSEAGEEYVRQSLAIEPNGIEAKLFLGFIILYGLDDPARAIPPLEAALEIQGLPESSLMQIEQALEEARQGVNP